MCLPLKEEPPGSFPFKLTGKWVLRYLQSGVSKWYSGKLLTTSFLAKPHSQKLIYRRLHLSTPLPTCSGGHETLTFPGTRIPTFSTASLPIIPPVLGLSPREVFKPVTWKPSSLETSLCVFPFTLYIDSSVWIRKQILLHHSFNVNMPGYPVGRLS